MIKSEAWDDPDIAVLDERRAYCRNFQSMLSLPRGKIYCCVLLTAPVLQHVMSRFRCLASHQA